MRTQGGRGLCPGSRFGWYSVAESTVPRIGIPTRDPWQDHGGAKQPGCCVLVGTRKTRKRKHWLKSPCTPRGRIDARCVCRRIPSPPPPPLLPSPLCRTDERGGMMRCRARIEREGFPSYPIWFRKPFRIPTASSLLPTASCNPSWLPATATSSRSPLLSPPPPSPAAPSPSPSSYWHPIVRIRDESDERGDDSARHQSSVSSQYVRGPEDSPKKFLGSIRSRARASNTNTVPVRHTFVLFPSGEASCVGNVESAKFKYSAERKR